MLQYLSPLVRSLLLISLCKHLDCLLPQVIKQRLAIAVPCLTAVGETGDFEYQEGEGLDPDEIDDYTVSLPKTLASLPGGGIKNDSVILVDDFSQALKLNLHIRHQVGVGSLRWGGAAAALTIAPASSRAKAC